MRSSVSPRSPKAGSAMLHLKEYLRQRLLYNQSQHNKAQSSFQLNKHARYVPKKKADYDGIVLSKSMQGSYEQPSARQKRFGSVTDSVVSIIKSCRGVQIDQKDPQECFWRSTIEKELVALEDRQDRLIDQTGRNVMLVLKPEQQLMFKKLMLKGKQVVLLD